MRTFAVIVARTASVALALGTLLAGCAGDVDLVDRVQPDYVRKTDLTHKSWYYRRTVVDAPETMAPHASVGTGDLFTIERVRWEIQEDYLLAYRNYEAVPGSEDAGYEGSDYYGTPVVAFPIKSHFDIIDEYNPETGEKTNVREENTKDRMWWEREYMRIDWSKLAVGGDDMFVLPVDFMDANKVPGGNFYVHGNEATNPWRARLTPEKGYFDFVVNHYAEPDLATCYYDFDFDLGDVFDNVCGSGEFRVRYAFMAVDPERATGYKPLYYPDSVTLKDATGKEISDPTTGEVLREPIYDRFGFYRLERLTYDHERELTESGRLNRLMRFDIWERDVYANGDDIPYPERRPRPIHYYLNWDFPAELMDAAMAVGAEWNQVFRGTVAALQAVPIDQVQDMFLVHTNGCSAPALATYLAAHPDPAKQVRAALGVGDDAVPQTDPHLANWCAATEYYTRDLGDAFTWQQIGDPRYNMLYWISNITPAHWSGYGPMFADPESGRIVTSTAYIMGWQIETATTRLLEYVDYMNGELSLEDLLAGRDVPSILKNGTYDPKAATLDLQDVGQMATRMVSDEHVRQIDARFSALEATGNAMTPLDDSNHYDARLARLFGTATERNFLVRPEDLILASHGTWKPGTQVTDELAAQASPLRRARELSDRRERVQRFLQERTMCPVAELDDALVGLANKLKDLPRNERRLELKKAMFIATALHEVGHNVGLRHNFSGSFDALNYPRTFWDIEAQGLGEQDRLLAQQPEMKYSSIMDYVGKLNADFHGLAPYDQAAINFGYGQLVDTFSDANVTGGATLSDWRMQHDYRELVRPSDVDQHQDNHAPYFGSVSQMYDRTPVQFDWTSGNVTVDDVQKLHQHEVPYLYCSDEYANDIPTCKRFDFGANYREMEAAAHVSYKNYFTFNHYLRNRLVLDWGSALTRGEYAFHNTLLAYQYMYFYRYLSGGGDHNFFDGDAGRDMLTAVESGLNLLGEVISMPEPGTYYWCSSGPGVGTYYPFGSITWDANTPNSGIGPNGETCDMKRYADLPLGQGYPLFIGFSDDYVTWTITYLGTYWDKLTALEKMTYPMAHFYRFNQYEDWRSVSLSPYRLYGPEIDNILLGLVELDHNDLSSGLDEVTGKVVPRPMVEFNSFGNPAPAVATAKVVPALARNLQYYALMFGMAFLSSPYDPTVDFAKRARVALKGAPDDFAAFDDPANAGNLAECTLPEAGRTYRALRITGPFDPTGPAEDPRDVAFNFVTKCQTQVTGLQQKETDWRTAQTLVDTTPVDDPNFNAYLQDARHKEGLYQEAYDDLRASEQALSFMRTLSGVYGF